MSVAADSTELFLSVALCGNRMVLWLRRDDNFAKGSFDDNFAKGSFDDVHNEGKSRLFYDHTRLVPHCLSSAKEGTVVDIVVDNAKLLTDLMLAEHLTTSKGCKIRSRIIHHPTFISDVTESDLKSHLIVDN